MTGDQFAQHPSIVAWTGGTLPPPLSHISQGQRSLVSALFREQIEVWQSYWGDFPPRDALRTFWGRARCNAHATYRDFPHLGLKDDVPCSEPHRFPPQTEFADEWPTTMEIEDDENHEERP